MKRVYIKMKLKFPKVRKTFALVILILYLAPGTSIHGISLQVSGKFSKDFWIGNNQIGRNYKYLNRRKVLVSHFKLQHHRIRRSMQNNCVLTQRETEYLIFECKPTTLNWKSTNKTLEDASRNGVLLYNASIQFDAPLHTRAMRLWHQGFYGVEGKAFYGYNELEVLNMQNNILSYISIKAFTGLTKLIELNLSHNKVQTLPKNVFNGLDSLKRLYLSHNELEVVRDGVFCGLSNLIELRLNDNLIVDIEERTFSSLSTYRPLVINIENNFIKRPRPGWLKVGNYSGCKANNNTKRITGFMSNRKRVLEGDGNPWNCECLRSDNTIKFIHDIRSYLQQYTTWFVYLPCAEPEKSLEHVNIGGHQSITGKRIEKACCEITHEEILKSGASDLIDKMCDNFANRNHHSFMLSESNVTIIGIVIVMLIPILLTLSPDCRQRGSAVQPSGTVVSGGRFGTTINTNNNNDNTHNSTQIVTATTTDNKFTVTSV